MEMAIILGAKVGGFDATQLAYLSVVGYLFCAMVWLMLFWINRSYKGTLGGVAGCLFFLVIAYRTYKVYILHSTAYDKDIMVSVYITALMAVVQSYCFIAPHWDNIKQKVIDTVKR